jgi:hypothetical protein
MWGWGGVEKFWVKNENMKNGKNSTNFFLLFFSFDKFSLKLIEITTKMTLGYLDIAQLGFWTKKKSGVKVQTTVPCAALFKMVRYVLL